MHSWGDDWPFWEDLYRAESFIEVYVWKWSRCSLMTKEKWGSIRYERLYPGRFMLSWKLDQLCAKVFGDKQSKYGPYPRVRWSGSWLYNVWARFGLWVTRRAIQKACLKWPRLTDELMQDGCQYFSERIENMYWTKVNPGGEYED